MQKFVRRILRKTIAIIRRNPNVEQKITKIIRGNAYVEQKITKILYKNPHTKNNVGKVKTIMGRPVLTIKEICAILEVKIPTSYHQMADCLVTETPLFEVLEDKDKMIAEMKIEADFPKTYYNALNIATKKFENRFRKVALDVEKTDLYLLKMFVQWQYVFRPRGFYYQDYFDYKLYNRSISESEKFISAEYRIEISNATKVKGYVKYLANKSLFNKTFSKYVNRDYLNMRKCTLDEFESFVKKHPIFFGKPLAGTGGHGAGFWRATGNIEALFNDCKKQDLIVEEIVKQHKELAKFNADTLNTIRIYTLLKMNDEPIVTLSSVRMGRKGSAVDNFHSGGVGASIDVETGIVVSEAIDLDGNRWRTHPDSGEEIKGFQLPAWDKAIQAAKEAAKLMPNVRHIGWDVAITESGEIEFMEGNSKANFHIPQAAEQIGKKPLYEKHINDFRAKKEEENSLLEAEFDYVISKDKVKIVKYKGEKKDLTIPDKIQGLEVSIIGANSFANLSFLESVKSPDSVKVINREAFMNCENLKKIELSPNTTTINQSAFKNCKNLKSVRLPYFLKKICQNAFKDCVNLEEFYHYSMQGIGTSNPWVDYDSGKETELPTRIEYFGAYAFSGCSSLKEITLPWRVDSINEGVFEGCSSLERINIHNNLKEIKSLAFSSCQQLKEIKLPYLAKKIAPDAFDKNVTIVSEKATYAAKYADEKKLPFRAIVNNLPLISSDFVPKEGETFISDDHKPFYTEEQIQPYIEKFEMRQPSYKLKKPLIKKTSEKIPASRFKFQNGIYTNKIPTTQNRAVIRMTGDLMCRRRQQERAKKEENYNFDGAFHFVRDILRSADFSIANLETTISPSSPRADEIRFINNTANFNAPEQFLLAVKNASFDALNNAQNHIYDTGLRGIFETLDMQNKYQFMHLGAYASENDKRYLMVNINGIKVAFIAHFDAARQQMKKVNFTKQGREVMTNTFSSQAGGDAQVIRDVENAKAEGAEFIVAFCHWGREYINETTERQESFAYMVANAGVDYIFGSHPHCLQPYDIIKTDDGREVPVFYSAGNFISDININAPITRDSIIGELVLVKDKNGKVIIESDGYYPCRIMDLKTESFNYTVIPTEFEFTSEPKRNESLKDAESRIGKVLGEKVKKLTSETIKLNIDLSKTPSECRKEVL